MTPSQPSVKDLFLERFQEKMARLAAPHSRFELFEIAVRHLLYHLDSLDAESFVGEEYVVLHQLQKTIEPLDSESARWALICIDLWYCRNFHERRWRHLVQQVEGNIRFAVQAAFYVWASSGSDSAPALRRLLAGAPGKAAARPYLEGLRRDPYASKWVDRVLGVNAK